jgi:hypothetical protein
LDTGDEVIHAKAELGREALTDLQRLIYSLWVADYGMRNAGDLATARDVYPEFKSDGLKAAMALKLQEMQAAFSMPDDDLQARYFELFDALCEEIRSFTRR